MLCKICPLGKPVLGRAGYTASRRQHEPDYTRKYQEYICPAETKINMMIMAGIDHPSEVRTHFLGHFLGTCACTRSSWHRPSLEVRKVEHDSYLSHNILRKDNARPWTKFLLVADFLENQNGGLRKYVVELCPQTHHRSAVVLSPVGDKNDLRNSSERVGVLYLAYLAYLSWFASCRVAVVGRCIGCFEAPFSNRP